jgi:hypothetical protein
MQTGKRRKRRSQLQQASVPDSSGIVIVESFVFYRDAKAGADSIMMVGVPCVDKQESKIAAYVALMRDYYGFTVELF